MASGKAFLALPCTCCGGGGAKVCKGCRLAHFCSRDCQRAAWAQHALSCTSAKHGACSPGPKLELVDTGLQGAGLRATAGIGAGEEVLTECPLLAIPATASAALRARLEAVAGEQLPVSSDTAEEYVLHILAAVHALYDAPEGVRRQILTELCQPVAGLAQRLESELNAEPCDGGGVVAHTLSHAAQWRDSCWACWPGADPSSPTCLPHWLTHSEFVRFLLIFQSNAWSLAGAVPLSEGSTGGTALFRLGSKFNHSCDPNVRTNAVPSTSHCVFAILSDELQPELLVVQTAFCWEEGSDATASRGLFFALRDIAAGEAATVSYLSEALLSCGVEERRRHLTAKPGMERVLCSCARCIAEASGGIDPAGADDDA